MKVGYIKSIRGSEASNQADMLLGEGVVSDQIWGETRGAGWTLKECLGSLRSGDELCVTQLAVLAYPVGRKKRLPRQALHERLAVIADANASIYEVETGRRFKPDRAAVEAIFTAADTLAGQARGRPRGRPTVKEFGAKQWLIIEGLMRKPGLTIKERAQSVRDLGPEYAAFNMSRWYRYLREAGQEQ